MRGMPTDDAITNPARSRGKPTLLGDALAIAAPFVAGGIGAIATTQRIPTWYRSLDKPAFNPPDAVFSPVWSTLYLLIGVAAVLVRHSEAAPRDMRLAHAANSLQLALNLAWSLV